MADEANTETWKTRCAVKKKQQQDSIPKEWLIQLPSPMDGQINVMDVPRTCGLLSVKEIIITETDDISAILQNLADGTWSSTEVTTAFYKRAIVAHQLVKFWVLSLRLNVSYSTLLSDELFNRDFR